MRPPSFALIVLATVCSLRSSPLCAQTTGYRPPEARTARSVERQRNALTRMAVSIARQQSSLGGVRRNYPSDTFFASENSHIFTAAATGPECDALPPNEVETLINEASHRTLVPPELLRSVIRQESGFHACAVSPKGAMGLMQLLPSTAGDLGVADPFDPQANVLGGARLLKQLIDRYGGDLSLALSAYNAGAGKVDSVMRVPMIPETIDYVNRILSRLSTQPLPATDQSALDNAPDTSFLLIGADGGK